MNMGIDLADSKDKTVLCVKKGNEWIFEQMEIANKTELEKLLKDKEHYEYMKKRYSLGEVDSIKIAIVEDSQKKLHRINEEIKELRGRNNEF